MTRHYASVFTCLSLFLVLILPARPAEPGLLDLSGTWEFQLAGAEPQFPQGTLPSQAFPDAIELPGTTETRAKGALHAGVELGRPTRVRKFEGAAWYRRTVEIPSAWAGRRVTLLLERTRYTQVWWDDRPLGEQRWFTGPQRYDLSEAVQPGRHTLTVMVDNRPERRPFKADPHEYSDHTQTNWNGIVGRIELRADLPVSISDVQVYGDYAAKTLRVETQLTVTAAAAVGPEARVVVRAQSTNHPGLVHTTDASEHLVPLKDGIARSSATLQLGDRARTWDEFSPALYLVTVRVETAAGVEERTVQTGLREFKARGTQIAVNGRTTFLRGKHDACVFPLTGHPPMDVEGWLDYFRKLQDYGINHVRCHTWAPPEAAFIAADRLGIYLQPELPFWGTFDSAIRDALQPDAERLLKEYGNHPSFVMFTLGNELGGDRALMNALVQHLRALDPRRLYADGSNNVLWDPDFQPTNDFWISAKAKTPSSGGKALPARGSYYLGDGYDGVVQWGSGETRSDLRAATDGISAPVIGHEIGQWTVYPNYREIPRYSGVVEARNLEHFRAVMEKNGLLAQADSWFRASGALAASLYKEEIELALRTPGFGGFQLLDLQDYPGQGTALVGILNPFMESKGLITEAEWLRFCSPIVPLARFDRYTFVAGETYEADIEVAHYGRHDLPGAQVTWAIVDEVGRQVGQGSFSAATLKQGGLRGVGKVQVRLPHVLRAMRYDLEVTVASGAERHINQWPLWVYPSAPAGNAASTVRTATDWASAKALLRQGARVLYLPSADQAGYTVGGAYATDFWCWPMFSSSPGTMGLLIDPRHPALSGFPTRFHSERQWTALAAASRPVILTRTPAELQPMVQVIDNLARNEKLGLIFEARVGDGRLLVCAADLLSLQDRPEARQLLASLGSYAASASFSPQVNLSEDALDALLRPSLAEGGQVTASSFHQPPWGAVPKPERVVDGDINTRWTAKEGDSQPWVAVDLGRDRIIDTVQLLWEAETPGVRYAVEGSKDGTTWEALTDATVVGFESHRHTHLMSAPKVGVRHVRVRVQGTPDGKPASLRDLRVLGQ